MLFTEISSSLEDSGTWKNTNIFGCIPRCSESSHGGYLPKLDSVITHMDQTIGGDALVVELIT